jgi:hypothetical protein
MTKLRAHMGGRTRRVRTALIGAGVAIVAWQAQAETASPVALSGPQLDVVTAGAEASADAIAGAAGSRYVNTRAYTTTDADSTRPREVSRAVARSAARECCGGAAFAGTSTSTAAGDQTDQSANVTVGPGGVGSHSASVSVERFSR